VTLKAVIGLIRASALSAALFLAGGAIPIAGAVLLLLTPAPIIGHAVGRPAAAWRTIAAIMLTATAIGLAAGPFALMAYTVSFGLATAIICYMLERQMRFEAIVAVTAGAVLAAGSITLVIAAGSPAALVATFRDGLSAALARTDEIYKLMGISPATEADSHAKLADMIVQLGPALAGIAAASAVLINLAVFWRWVGKKRLTYNLFGDLARWSTPEWLIWVLIAAGFALFVPAEPARTAALDVFLGVATIYFCQGLAVMAFYLNVLSTPAPWRGVIYFIAGIQPVLAALVSAVGVFDLWVDFRRLRPPSPEADGFSDLM
jgi:uncharacterized protein YybS (DUF2232 family)